MRDLLRRVWRIPPAAPAILADDPENPDTWYGLDYVHDRVAAQLREQPRLWEEADARSRLILGVIGIILAATLGLLPRGTISVMTLDGLESVPLLLPFWVGALAATARGLYAVAGGLAAVAYWPRTFSWPLAPEALRQYLASDERELKLIVIDEMLDAYAANAVWLGRKVRLFRWAFVVATGATTLLGSGVVNDRQLTQAACQ